MYRKFLSCARLLLIASASAITSGDICLSLSFPGESPYLFVFFFFFSFAARELGPVHTPMAPGGGRRLPVEVARGSSIWVGVAPDIGVLT